MSNHHQLRTPAGTPDGGPLRTDDQAKSEASLAAEAPLAARYAAETDPAARQDVVKEALETTPASEISIVDIAEIVTTDDHPDWRRADEPVASMCLAEVRVFGERHWCHWWQQDEEVHVEGVFADRAAAESSFWGTLAGYADVFDEHDHYKAVEPDWPDIDPEMVEELVDQGLPFYVLVTGLPEDVCRLLMKGRVDAMEVRQATGGNPTQTHIDTYRMIGGLRA